VATGLVGSAVTQVTGLQDGTGYGFRYLAVGPTGSTPGPEEWLYTPWTPPDVPGAPTFSEITRNSLVVMAPAWPNHTDYMVLQRKIQGQDDSAYVWLGSATGGGWFDSGWRTQVNGLSPGTTYTFRYVAYHGEAETAGTPADVMTLQVPDAPGAPQISNVAQTSLTATLPDLPTGALSLTLQRKLSSQAESAYASIASGKTGGAVVQVTGLSGSSTYDFRVLAVGAYSGTPGPAVQVTTGTVPTSPPGPPTFSNLTASSVRVIAPVLPTGATTLTLQRKLATEADAAFSDVEADLAGGAVTDVTGLAASTGYAFRYVAVGPGGSTPGPAAQVTTSSGSGSYTWSAGSAISSGGIRWPYAGAVIRAGSEGALSAYLATDWDQRDEVQLVYDGEFSDYQNVSRPYSDPCRYIWSASGGSFRNGVNTGQSVGWIAPTAPGTYTITLTVDDQNAANKPAGEGGSRNDALRGYNDEPLRFSVTVTVSP
jgi:hypothetical protein